MANPFPFSVGAVLTAAQMNSIGENAIAYTPTVSAISGTITSYTVAAKSQRVNKICIVQFQIAITNAGTASVGYKMTLPFTAVAAYGNVAIGVARETALTGFMQQLTQNGTGEIAILRYDNAFPGGTGSNIQGTIIYEVA
jgi:hypothetical protein